MTSQRVKNMLFLFDLNSPKIVPKANGQNFLLWLVVINKNASDDRKRVYARDSIEAKKCHAVA